jgi:nucleoside-diphosphate kinase
MPKTNEKTLIIIKPDALQRSLFGEIMSRFEKKGFKIVGIKMIRLSEKLVSKHYSEHKGKPFLPRLKKFMKSAPVIVAVLEGMDVVNVVRMMVGPTDGKKADAGSIRGDYSISGHLTIIHASDSRTAAKKEISNLFGKKELFGYKKIDFDFIYSEDER